MADTYTQIYIHLVFAVKRREGLVARQWKEELYKYITGIITNKGHKLIAINGMPDHIHILVGMKPTMSLSDLVREIKANSSRFVNEQRFVKGKFEWQNGFGAFSCGHSQLDTIINYIKRQEEHHTTKKISFSDEYLEFLRSYEIDYNKEYLFEDIV